MEFTKTVEISLSDVTKPLLVVSRLVGINPKSQWHKIYTGIILACDFSLLCKIWQYRIRRNFQNFYFHMIVHALQDICCIASIFAILGLSLFDRRRFMVPVGDFVTVDESLKSIGGRIDNRATYRLEVLQLVCVGLFPISFWLSEFRLRITAVPDEHMYAILLTGWFYYLIVLFESAIVDCCFSVTLSVIKNRFKEINSIIRRVGTHDSYSRINVLEVSRPRAHTDNDILKELKVLRSQYHILWGIANQVNDAYGPHLLVGITSSLALITIKLYETYSRLAKIGCGKSGMLSAAASSTNWVLFCVVRIFALAQACESTVAEAKATYVILQELRMTGDHSPATKDEIRDFFTQLQFEARNFTAYKFFDINFSLVCSILAAACTYLVICIQMDDSNSCTVTAGNSNGSLHLDSKDN